MPDMRVTFPSPCHENWGAMAPAACGRLCERCDSIVHNLSEYTADEARSLVERNPHACVRAQVGSDGSIALKAGQPGRAVRMVLAAAAGAGLLAAQPAMAKPQRPGGAIVGKVDSFGIRIRITATDRAGRTFRVKARPDGRYKFKNLPAGAYELSFEPECGAPWTLNDVTVGEGPTAVPRASSPEPCIIVGMLQIESSGG